MNRRFFARTGVWLVLMTLFAFAQAGCSKEEDPPMMELSQPAMEFGDWEAASQPLSVTTNSGWTASVDAENSDWCRLSISRGRGSRQIDIMVGESNDNRIRSAVVTFKTTGRNSVTRTVLVTQQGENIYGE